MQSKFIVLEGLEGAGKSTACRVVTDVLHRHAITDIVYTREPGGTPLAEKLRQIIKQQPGSEPLTDCAELLMLYAARVQLVETVIKPALQRGAWVVGDRHDLSSQAYQGGGRGLNQQLIDTLRQLTLGDFRPDLTLYLDISPERGLARVRARGELDRIEQQALPFFVRTRQRYLELAHADPCIKIIDAGQSLARVAQALTTTLTDWFRGH